MMKMSPMLRRKRDAASQACLRDRIVSTPASEIATPTDCSGVSRSRRNTHENVMIITGMNELRMTPLVAVV